MRYMLLIYLDEEMEAAKSEEQRNEMFARCLEHSSRLRTSGILESGIPLQPTSAARTLRLQNGRAVTTDGPFAETKEHVGGSYVLNCRDLEEATRLAEEISHLHGNPSGAIEIRPILEIGQP